MKSVGEILYYTVREDGLASLPAGCADVVYNSVVLAVFPVKATLEQTIMELKDG